jgi:cell division protein FtsB
MKKFFKPFPILYAVTFVLFLVYLLFLSDGKISRQRELNKNIKELKLKLDKHKQQINEDYTFQKLINDSNLLEKYAREELNLHKANENVFIFE